jgi:protein-L-isoaspartate(D-aspartate) O-methyltransferase
MVAFMIQEAKITKNDRVLEIGAGCGYAAAVIGQIAQQVWAYEILPPLGEAAAEKIKELGYMNVNIKCGDGLKSSAAHGPFNAILVAACATKVPTELKELLALNGNLIIPVEMNGPNSVQILKRVVRIGEDEFLEEALEYVMFVPLIETP